MEIKRVDIVHLRVIGCLFEVLAKLVHAEMRLAIGSVILFGRADGNAGHEVFTLQFISARTVGKTVSQHAVEILL